MRKQLVCVVWSETFANINNTLAAAPPPSSPPLCIYIYQCFENSETQISVFEYHFSRATHFCGFAFAVMWMTLRGECDRRIAFFICWRLSVGIYTIITAKLHCVIYYFGKTFIEFMCVLFVFTRQRHHRSTSGEARLISKRWYDAIALWIGINM